MAEQFNIPELPKFSSPEEEIAFLREHIARREQLISGTHVEMSREEIAQSALREYQSLPKEKVLAPEAIMPKAESDAIVLRLSPESHDKTMEELLGILLQKGLKNALSVVEKLGNPHLDDDFHRFLVQYLLAAGSMSDLKPNTPLGRALGMRLYEITLPGKAVDDSRSFKDLIGAMEQFYAGMQSVAESQENKEKIYFTLEIALANVGSEVVFYAGVPKNKADLFEKQLSSFYSDAKVREMVDDYNIFTEGGAAAGAYAALSERELFPLRTYDTFDHDPMNTILNAFAKLREAGEGAAIQLIIAPAGHSFIKQFNSVLHDLRQGKSLKEAGTHSFEAELASAAKGFLFGTKSKEKEQEKKSDERAKLDEEVPARIAEKVKSSIVTASIRLVAAAPSRERAQQIISELESSFHQFEQPGSNRIVFRHPTPGYLPQFLHNFSYRLCESDELIPLNLKELTTIFHFPFGIKSAPQLKEARAGSAPAPLELAHEGVILGVNNYRGKQTEVRFGKEDRVRHMYVIGQTGTGKTNILKNMIIQDIKNGDGVCFIDPHGTDIQDILAQVPPERIDDVIYFDPAYTPRPMGLNMLEYDMRFPEQKTMVVDEMLSIFNKLFDMKTAGGPMFEQYFRNATSLVIDDPETGSTLLEISRVLADKNFRELKLSRCKNPIVIQFWREVADKAGGEASLANIVPYITSKFDVFLSNEIMRPIIGQQKSVLNFRQIMDEKKILLVNLSKGRLGEINANLIGLIIVGKILMAALSRVDMFGQKMNDFYLYIDEFQNVTTNSISQILSEARKYRLSLNIAHQYISQIDENIKNAVFGNVGSMAVFRVDADDAKYLESRFAPTITADDIIKLDNYNAYLRLLVNGQPVKPFNIETIAPAKGNPEIVQKLKELSYLKFGQPREEIEAEIMAKYIKKPLAEVS